MRNLALIALGFGILVLQAAGATFLPFHVFAPNLLLPVVIFLGVTHEVHIVRGAALSFVFGYLFDAFTGSPMGLMTFVLVATFIVSRFAGLRLFLRGPLFQILLTFFVSILAGGTILALRMIFERPAPLLGTFESHAITLLIPAASTAIVSPLVFSAVRRIESLASRRREERPATP